MEESARGTMVVKYVDGSEQKFEYVRQQGQFNVASYIHNALSANHLLLDLETKVLVIPFHNVLSIEISPSPSKLPTHVLRGVRLVE